MTESGEGAILLSEVGSRASIQDHTGLRGLSTFHKCKTMLLFSFKYLKWYHFKVDKSLMGNSTIPFFFFFFFGMVPISKQHVIPSYQNITFDSFIIILCSFNITCDSSFITFGGTFIFSHIWRLHSHIV